jgi:hypothetical protein
MRRALARPSYTVPRLVVAIFVGVAACEGEIRRPGVESRERVAPRAELSPQRERPDRGGAVRADREAWNAAREPQEQTLARPPAARGAGRPRDSPRATRDVTTPGPTAPTPKPQPRHAHALLPGDPRTGGRLIAPIDPTGPRFASDDSPAAAPDVGRQAMPGPPDSVPASDGSRLSSDTVPEHAASARQATSLGIRVRGRSELGGVWDRFSPCVGVVSQRCEPGVTPRLDPDVRLGVQVGGTLFDRIGITVDYDGTREFDSSNDIRVRYEGGPGELIRRVDAGNVSLAMPAARYLGAVVPAQSWGVRALAQTGPVEWQALWAQGGGEMLTREFRLGAGGTALQQLTSTWDDADYAGGQFFFLFDPARIRGYPHLDILTLGPEDAPAEWAPDAGVRLFRFEGGLPQRDGSTSTLRATAEGGSVAGDAEVSGAFRLLEEGEEYQLHRSGLWVALRQPLRDDEALAVAYRSRSGEAIGDPAAGGPSADPREVRLLRPPRLASDPAGPTWRLEMRHLYRVSGSTEVAPADLDLVISRGDAYSGDLGRSVPGHGLVPYLRLFGLDSETPADRIDPNRVYRPSDETVRPVVGGTFVVFPTLRPFEEPPAVPVLGLSAEQAAMVLGDARNPELYRAVDRRDRAAAARFRLRFSYRSSAGEPGSSISLGTLGIRAGSERVTAGGRVLQRGTDYDIDYELGRIELRGAAAGAGSELRVSFEQIPLFAARPVQVAALGARLPLGAGGELSVMGVSQHERTLLRRPTLGLESDAVLLAGMEGRYDWALPGLDRWLGVSAAPATDRVGGASDRLGASAGDGAGVGGASRAAGGTGTAAGASRLRLAGELAMSVSDPRSVGIAYLDDFEDGGDIEIPLLRHAWRLGSAPVRRDRAEEVLPERLEVASAGTLVWQHDYLGPANRTVGSLALREIDQRIRSTSRAYESNVLYLTMLAEAPRAWRSITTVLSPYGRDLRNHAYLELYVRPGSPADALVLDLGTVSEDAFAFDAAGNTGGIDEHGRPWGLGVLDQEWDPVRETWSSSADERGLWNADCRASADGKYPLGDPRANCTRGNGLADTEDLNGNGVLDTDERVFRFVVRPGDPTDPAVVADETETGTGFRLIRIPLDPAAGVGAGPGELRQVRHLRLTVVSHGGDPTVLARMRLLGSRWERRGETGVVGGLHGRSPEAGGRLEVGTIGRLDGANEYLSPPGVGDAPQDLAGTISSGQGSELTEQALRLRYAELEPGARAEVYRRYEGGPQSFLGYRELRLWALARDGRWGDGAEELVVRAGTDPENSYLYRVPLDRRGVPVSAESWRPEIVIELERWIRLRDEAERVIREGGGEAVPVVVWDADSTYAVVVREPGRAPNLAAIRELAISVHNAGGLPVSGELWVNELRLTGRERRPDGAGAITLDLAAADLARVRVGVARRGAHFRSLGATAAFQDESSLFLDAEVDLGRLLPREWGLEAPLTVQLDRAGRDPLYLEGTDLGPGSVHARDLGDRRRRVSLRLQRREDPGGSRLSRATVDNISIHVEALRTESTTPYTELQALDASAGVEYDVRPAGRSLALLPGGFAPARWFGRADAADAVEPPALRFRWTPVRIGVGTTWTDAHSDQLRFGVADLGPGRAADPIGSRSRRLVNHLSIGLQPFGSLTGSLLLRSGSDLLPSAHLNHRSAPMLDAERWRIGGLDLGRESERSTVTRLAWNPRLTDWLTTRASYNGTFALDAHPAYLAPGGSGVDPVPLPLRSFGLRRVVSSRWTVDPSALGSALGLAHGEARAAADGVLENVLGVVRTLELGWGSTTESRFERSDLRPGLGYQFGLETGSVSREGAALAADRTTWTARSVVDLPAAFAATVEYSLAEGDVAGPRGERTERERDWPNFALHWSGAPRRQEGVFRGGSVALGYSRRDHRLDDLRSDQRRTGTTTTVPADLSLRWAGGVTMSYRGEWRGHDATGPTSSTGQTVIGHAASISGALPAPAAISELVPAPVMASFRFADGVRRDCRLSDELPLCDARSQYSGHRERGWSLRLDSRTSEMNLGLSLERRDRVDVHGEPLRHRHFTLGFFGEFTVAAGTMP